jgi:hypothetical protein
MQRTKTVWVGTLGLLGETRSAYKICGTELFTADHNQYICACASEQWIPKSICRHPPPEIKANRDFPLMKEIKLILPTWFVNQNSWFEYYLDEVEPEASDFYARYSRA